mgnify:CR=1 FL=1|tara:strand:+ start:251 stop:397 length:147 start_codon:yes stop_codon:yes gene_type:complete
MEVPVFSRWWEIIIFLLLGLLLIPLIPFFLLLALWKVLRRKWRKDDEG